MSYDTLASLGWDADLAAAHAALGRPDLIAARVAAVHRGRVLLRGDEPDRLAPVAGALTHRTGLVPVAGDWVAAARGGAVEAVLPRRGVLARGGDVLAAHVDVALIATSLNQDLSLRRLERFAAIARAGGVAPLVLLTKGDLSPDPAGEAERIAGAVGEDVLVLSALDGWGLEALRARLAPARTAALVGMSGVGKSTLVNALLGEQRQRTLAIRDGDARGRHATTHRELFVLPGGALLLDTPGLRLPRVGDAEAVAATFADVEAVAHGCRFADCSHAGEPGCAVAAAIAAGELDPKRLRAHEKLAREAAHLAERDDPVAQRARRDRWKAIHREQRRLYRDRGH